MLHELHIEDLGVISSVALVLDEGLTVLTGETGAGKTMLVEAISLLVGGRADPSIVRSGADEARVEGRFVVGEDELVLSRVIPVNGRSRAYVNGRLATVATLAEHGARLVDIHGQHAHQSLLGAAVQRDALDRYAGVDLEPLRAARGRLTEIDASLAALGGDVRTRAREIDLLGFQIEELDAAALDDPDEEARLDALEDVLAGAVAHREAADLAVRAVRDDGGALDALGTAAAALHGRAPFEELATRLSSAAAELADVASELRSLGESIDEDPERLAEVRERRQSLRNLCRKYGDSLADVIEFRDATRARLAELHGYDQTVQRLEADRATALRAEREAAAAVGAARRAAAGALGAAIGEHLHALGMARATVHVSVGEDDPGDDVVFLLAANPGSPPLPLTKVASGGELARSMLAVRLVLMEAPDTLLFDEVDAGIGGAAATAVGRALAELGRDHQVLVVTHLAQVAALADAQIAVSKAVEGDVTTATATKLGPDERVAEIARMLSGDPGSATARSHAAELLAISPDPSAATSVRAAAALMAQRRLDMSVTARARPDRRTKDLVKRLEAGEIAVIDHADVDLVAADGLVESGVVAVVNAAASFTGRYPNLGPLQIVRNDVILLDEVGPDVLSRISEGEIVTIDGNRVIIGDEVVAVGRRRTEDELIEAVDEARGRVGEQLELFAANTLEYLRRERHLATDDPDLPDSRITFTGRQTLVVVRGIDFREDLFALHRSGYLREVRPVLIGVDGGADALRNLGYTPDIIIGDFDSVGEDTLRCGAELIVHAYRDGRAPGAERLARLGLPYLVFESAGTSEDIAMLLAYERGTQLIVAVGSHNSMEDFLDKGRAGMASTFLVRLKVGRLLVDAKGVNNLYHPVVKGRDIVLFVAAMLFSLALVVTVSEPVRLWFRSLWLWIRARVGW